MAEEKVEGEVQPEEKLEGETAPETKEEPPVVTDEVPEVDPETLKAEIDELRELKKKSQEEWYYWRERAAKKRAQIGTQEPVKPPETILEQPPSASLTEPQESNFDNYEDYVKALADYRAEQKIREFEESRRKSLERERVQEKQQEFWGKMQPGFEKYEDFEDVAFNPTVPITQQMAEILAEMDNPADVAYYLGKNVKDCIEISRMTATQAARKLGQIEREIVSNPRQPEQKPTTKAPPPIKPVTGGGTQLQKTPQQMSYHEYVQWRLSGGGR